MAGQKHFLRTPYGAYHNPQTPEEDTELTHVERGSACGEYLRRFWQPVAIASEVGELPLKVRMFGEDLVLFRSRAGEWGLLDLHCSHRGTSLEYGVVEPRGLRCCYHSWLFAPDGRILETPGEPPSSTLKDRLYHGAYPVEERDGLVFAYMGPPGKRPDFAPYDTLAMPDDRLVPYYITYPCNWLQVQENVMDPAHAVFLHTRISFSQFADAWGELPVTEFRETPTGMIYITTRRWGDNVWVRSNDIVFGNIAQVGHIWEDGQEPKLYLRVGITRWTTPVDNQTCRIVGWRHFHPDGDPGDNADEGKCGPESVDFFGQDGARTYEDRQRIPGRFRRPDQPAADRRPCAGAHDRHRQGCAHAAETAQGRNTPRGGGRRSEDAAFPRRRPDSDLLPRHGGPHPGGRERQRRRAASPGWASGSPTSTSRARTRTPPTATRKSAA